MSLLREHSSHSRATAVRAGPATIVCVLGMHRSGTSVATRLLNLLGVDLGPEHRLLQPGPANPKGFWEHRPIVQLNDAILGRMGGSSYHVPPLPRGWALAPELEGLRHRAASIVREDFSHARCWGWKDPRTCLTLPFWQGLLRPMRYVLCFRNPADVARSLERRDRLSAEWSLYLWLLYSLLALRGTDRMPRTVVFYEDLMDDWRRELRAMAAFLGTPERADDPETQRAAAAFVDDGLRHHRSAAETPAGDDQGELDLAGRALRLAQQAYAELRREAPRPEAAARALADGVALLEPEVRRQRAEAARRWQDRVELTMRELSAVIPAGDAFVLVDAHQFGSRGTLAGRHRIPFFERNGTDWGTPPDDETALRALERVRHAGASFVAFAWPAFWWLTHFGALGHRLRDTAACVLANDRIRVFDVRG